MILAGAQRSVTDKLQRVLNAAARLERGPHLTTRCPDAVTHSVWYIRQVLRAWFRIYAVWYGRMQLTVDVECYWCRRVHITESTLDHLHGEFDTEPAHGDQRNASLRNQQISTYFIVFQHPRKVCKVSTFLLQSLQCYSYCVTAYSVVFVDLQSVFHSLSYTHTLLVEWLSFVE